MDDEIELFADGRPGAPPYPPEARAAARSRLMQETRARRGLRLPRLGFARLGRSGLGRSRLGWQAAGAFGLTVVLVGGVAFALSGPSPAPVVGARGDDSVSVVPTIPGELDPQPGQFILIESETMYSSYSFGEKEGRHLYRTKRKIWHSVDGTAAGLLSIEGREPKEFPGWPIPADAKKWEGTSWSEIAAPCPQWPKESRRAYVHLSAWPTEAGAMRERLYQGAMEGKVSVDQQAFTAAGDLVRETYLPSAQRRAVFEAARAIPGVEVAEGVEDSAGREGTALGLVARGTLEQLIFDPETYLFMGERGTVVDEKVVGAPKGSVIALTAETGVSVVDTLPVVENAGKDGSCDLPMEADSPAPPSVTASAVPTGSSSTPPPPHPTAEPVATAPTTVEPTALEPTAVEPPSAEPTVSASPTG